MKNISFKGLINTEQVADKQIGGTCWLEAIENMIQFYDSSKDNNFSKELREIMRRDHFSLYDPIDDVLKNSYWGFYTILKAYGIESDWYYPDHQTMYNALYLNKPIIVLGEVSRLGDPIYGTKIGMHAIVLTDASFNENNILVYTGIDSNHEKQAYRYHWQTIQSFADGYTATMQRFNLEKGYPINHETQSVLIPRNPAKWKYKNTPY